METGIFNSVHDSLAPLSNGVGTTVGGLVAIGGLIYVGAKVWPALAKGEQIDFYPLLRPFFIGLFCMFFNALVITPLQYVLSPVKNYAEALTGTVGKGDKTAAVVRQNVEKLREDRQELMSTYNQLKDDASLDWSDAFTGKFWSEDLWKSRETLSRERQRASRELDAYVEENPELVELDALENSDRGGVIRQAILDALASAIMYIVECVYALMIYVFHLLRTVFLVLLNVFGPIALGLSIFPGFNNNIVNWLSKYVSIYLWSPIVNLIQATVFKASIIITSLPAVSGQFSSTSLMWISVVVQIIGIAALFAVPTISSWIVQGGEDGRAMKGFSIIGGLGAAYAGSKVGKAANFALTGTGNVARELGKKFKEDWTTMINTYRGK